MGCASGSSLSAPHPTLFRRQRCPTRPPLRVAPRITACERADEKFDLGQRFLGVPREEDAVQQPTLARAVEPAVNITSIAASILPSRIMESSGDTCCIWVRSNYA